MTYFFAAACGGMLVMGVAEWAEGSRRSAAVSWAMAAWLAFTTWIWTL